MENTFPVVYSIIAKVVGGAADEKTKTKQKNGNRTIMNVKSEHGCFAGEREPKEKKSILMYFYHVLKAF